MTSSRRIAAVDALRRHDDAELDRACPVAADAHAQRHRAVVRLGAQTHVGRERFGEVERAAAVDGNADTLAPALRRATRRASARRNSPQERRRREFPPRRVPASGLVRTGMPSSAAMPSAAMSVGKARRRRRGQAANLDAAAAGDFDDAVAARPRRRAQCGERVERDGADRHEPHQQSVAGRHRRGKSRTGAAALQ